MFPDSWTEVCLIGITRKDSPGTKIQFAALTETADISQGDKPITWLANVKGGRIPKYDPEEETEITLEIYPAGISSSNGMMLWFTGDTDANTTPVISAVNTHNRKLFRVVLLWTNDIDVTEAEGAITDDAIAYAAVRGVYRDAHLISCKTDFTDKILKVTVKFSCPPFNKDASGLFEWQETDDASVATGTPLAALADVGYDS